MSSLSRGYIQIYTGNGKGKTTAALGLGVRAAGNGMRVYMIQFLKGSNTGELESIKKLEPNFTVFRFESKRGFFWTLSDEEKAELKKEVDTAFRFAMKVLKAGECDILILDEVMGALKNGLLSESEILDLINIKPQNIELVMTGRNVPETIISRADLVTEMKDIKHYFEQGVAARQGIEY